MKSLTKPQIGDIKLCKIVDPSKSTGSISAIAGSVGYVPPGKDLSITLDVIAHRDSSILSLKIFERTNVCEMTHRPMLGSLASLNTITPCVARKLLRRRCAEELSFSPYFSPLEPEKFEYVHRVFGARNVCRIISEILESEQDTTNTLVYEANARIQDPVYGSTRIIYSLQYWALAMQVELNAVRAAIMTHNCRDPVLLHIAQI